MSTDIQMAQSVQAQSAAAAVAGVARPAQAQESAFPQRGKSATVKPADMAAIVDALKEKTGKDKDALVSQAAEQLNGVMQSFNKGMRFEIFEDTGQMYVQVVNRDNNEVIRTIPSEDMLELMSRLNDAIGMLVDKQG